MVSLIYGYDTGVLIRHTTSHIIVILQSVAGVTLLLCLFGAIRSFSVQLQAIIK